MRQLSEHDASFIYADSDHVNSNVSLLFIYDQSTAPGGVVRFKKVLETIESRLDQLPILREKIQRVPLDMDYPYWVGDESFDIENHVRHIALPKPGDWRQFCILASRIHARSLDLNRPLWEMYVIEGLDSFLDLPKGSFAVLLKMHHAAIDLEHGSGIAKLLHDPTPVPVPPQPVTPWFPESPPGNMELLLRAGAKAATFPLRIMEPLSHGFDRMMLTAKTLIGEFLRWPAEFPMIRFNSVVSSRRVFDTRRFPLADFKAIRALVSGATVNDVVLAVCAGGLRSYLQAEGELPDSSLVAAAPITVRVKPGVGEMPDLSWVRVALRTDIADPVERLREIHATTASSEVMSKALGARELSNLANYAPAAALAATSKMLRSAATRMGGWTPLANCAITNVPGPSVPLYLQGARLTYCSSILPIHDGMGLVFSVTSYNEMLVMSFTACYEQLPNPEAFAQCLRDSFQEYLALARPAPKVRVRRAVSSKSAAPKRKAA